MRPWLGALRRAALPLLAGCVTYPTSPARPGSAAAQECRFTNPVAAGADPWVVRHDSAYYLVQSKDRTIWVYKSDQLTEPTVPSGQCQ